MIILKNCHTDWELILTKSIFYGGRHEEGGRDERGGDEDEYQGSTRHHHVGSLSLADGSAIVFKCLSGNDDKDKPLSPLPRPLV